MPESVPSRRAFGLPQIAHLRAVAKGIAPVTAATTYLPVESRHSALAAHRALIDQARGLARAAKFSDARLVGLVIAGAAKSAGHSSAPDLDTWMAKNGLEDWSEEEVLRMYREVFPPDRRARSEERRVGKEC